MNRIDEILALIRHVPPFPKVAARVMQVLKDPDVTAHQLAEVIQYDQAITANVLKICNAAYFGIPRKVNSLDEGLVVIGHDILKDIIIASSSARFYQGQVGAGYGLEQGDMWRHSVATGIMAKLLVKHIEGVDSGSAFTAALLHDIGKRFLSSFVADDFEKIVAKVARENCTFVEAEQEILGIDHAALGGMILEKWEFDQQLIDAVREHHNAAALEGAPLTALVALSNNLVISIGIGVGDDGLASELRGDGLKRFGITLEMLQICMADLLTELDRAQELLNI
ncbi:MAG: HDOD domain-containing protein [Proteobacteria bacterium]|nr:HDOD domain-containing protein [Pseudomonadota bacterium]MBU4296749.1 HDOD domain-containing protein [Pseudomonadota bacterium]MCG2745937.1 HDOD domain-containing protein [Desulfobulbaceae bacterium]